jgi:redox-sensitive bicupin YhaK (pirin superfamily)
MSWQSAAEPECSVPSACDPVDTVIVPRARDLGGFEVRRALPAAQRQMVGPFIFFDQMGPAEFLAGTGMDVRPHPHIGLSTLTWLIDGTILHRDSLGSVQPIRPGEVNWMTAGRGIAHSERTPPQQRAIGARLFGLQTWLALPKKHEETEPRFDHYPAGELPVIDGEDLRVTLIAGSGWGQRSPVAVFSETLYADADLAAGASLPIPLEHDERAVYLLSGKVRIAGEAFAPGSLLVLKPGADVTIRAEAPSRLLALGGEPMDGPRFIWWNFVSSSKERIQQAQEDWKARRFAPVPGDDEFIPLPER